MSSWAVCVVRGEPGETEMTKTAYDTRTQDGSQLYFDVLRSMDPSSRLEGAIKEAEKRSTKAGKLSGKGRTRKPAARRRQGGKSRLK